MLNHWRINNSNTNSKKKESKNCNNTQKIKEIKFQTKIIKPSKTLQRKIYTLTNK